MPPQELGGDAPYGPQLGRPGDSAQGVAWHHSKLLRREEQAQRRKQRKRQWMQKMYAMARTEGTKGTEGTEGGGGGGGTLLGPTDGEGPGGAAGDAGAATGGWSADEDDLDGELEQMLKWSDALDFESYHKGWLGLATSARPEWPGEAVAY